VVRCDTATTLTHHRQSGTNPLGESRRIVHLPKRPCRSSERVTRDPDRTWSPGSFATLASESLVAIYSSAADKGIDQISYPTSNTLEPTITSSPVLPHPRARPRFHRSVERPRASDWGKPRLRQLL
jgi:hypothetical protein